MTATFSADSDRPSVRLRRRYPHPIEKVWQAISQPEHLAAWFPASVAFAGGDQPSAGRPSASVSRWTPCPP